MFTSLFYFHFNCILADTDDCSADRCIHGSCTDGVDSFTCTCEAGYTGELCEVGEILTVVGKRGVPAVKSVSAVKKTLFFPTTFAYMLSLSTVSSVIHKSHCVISPSFISDLPCQGVHVFTGK